MERPVRGVRVGAAILTLLPWLLCAAATVRFGFDAPYWDQWWYAPVIGRVFSGEFAVSDLWMRVNEHIVFVPNLVLVPLARLTHWNIRFEHALTLLLFTAVLGVLLREAVRAARNSGRGMPLWIAPALAWLLFSYSMHAIWIWGFLSIVGFAMFGVVMAVVCLSRDALTWRHFGVALIAACAATFSIGAGLSVWPAGAMVLVLRIPGNRNMRAYLAAWLGLGGVVAAIYYAASDGAANPVLERLSHPIAFIAYVLTFLGAPLGAFNGVVAMSCGAGFCIAVIPLVKRIVRATETVDRITALALGLVTVAFVSGLLTALKHLPEGFAHATSSRFVAWPTLGWCGLVLWYSVHAPQRDRSVIYWRGGGILAACLLIGSSAHGIYRADERHDAFVLGRDALIHDTLSSDIRFLYPERDVVEAFRPLLVEHNLTVFRNVKTEHEDSP